MRIRSILAGGMLAILGCLPASAASFNFNVLYFGGGVATLEMGSDDPNGQEVDPGDDFNWNIAAQDDAAWRVDIGGNFFPLMAFQVTGEGTRTGTFTLTLRNDGLEVFGV